jgi:hypothetical protein
MNIVRLAILIILLAGCEVPLLNKNINRNPVKLQDDGSYIYDYDYEIYTSYCRAIADEKVCASETLKLRDLIPANCKNFHILKAGWAQNGGGWAKFYCN